jgi:hypothetical protein
MKALNLIAAPPAQKLKTEFLPSFSTASTQLGHCSQRAAPCLRAVALHGSCGSYFSIRAAAFEPRIKHGGRIR